MWFILLFVVCGLAIPIALEIHARGSDNILVRSGQDLARSPLGKQLARFTGRSVGWVQSVLAVVVLFVLVAFLLRGVAWLFGLIF